jgi:hypothetical protein
LTNCTSPAAFIPTYTTGQNGIKNGALLQCLLAEEFDALLTFDKNLQYQQNFDKYTITVFVLSARINQYAELTKLTPRINELLAGRQLLPGPLVISAEQP